MEQKDFLSDIFLHINCSLADRHGAADFDKADIPGQLQNLPVPARNLFRHRKNCFCRWYKVCRWFFAPFCRLVSCLVRFITVPAKLQKSSAFMDKKRIKYQQLSN